MVTRVLNPLFQMVSSNGDGSGLTSQNGNYSVTPQLFFVQPPAGRIYLIYHFTVNIADTAAFGLTDYGGILGGLTNGIAFQQRINNVVSNPMVGYTIKRNYQWGIFEPPLIVAYGNAQCLTENINVVEHGGPFVLDGNQGDYLGMLISDNLTALNDQVATVSGEWYAA